MRYHNLVLFPTFLGAQAQNMHFWGRPENVTDEQGSCNSAVDLMTFHRQKINEFLCKKFLAEEIVSAENGMVDERRRDAGDLMADTGSVDYSDWLARSSTLEDIYRHYEQTGAADAPIPSAVPLDAFDGEVTGYAMLGNNGKVAADAAAANEPAPYGYGGNVGAQLPAHMYGGFGHTYNFPKASSSNEKGMKLDDLFHLALTAIAFMAFGTFACEIVMCLMGIDTKAKQSKLTVISTNEPFEAYQRSGEPEMNEQDKFYNGSHVRTKRSTQETLSEISAYAISNLDGLGMVVSDGGAQVQKTLCIANRFARSLSGRQRLWFPLLSFGVGWIGGEISQGVGSGRFLAATVQGMLGICPSV